MMLLQSLWLIPLAPAVAAVASFSLSGEGRVARGWSPRLASGATAVALLVAGALSVRAVAALRGLPSGAERVDVLGEWIPKLPVATRDAMGILDVPWGLRLDPKSTMLLLGLGVCAVLAHAYASLRIAYQPRVLSVRMAAYLSSSVGFLVLIALGSSWPVVFAGWAGVVATSALVEIPSETGVDRRAQPVLAIPIGLTGFMLAIGLTFATFGTLDIRAVERAAATLAPGPARWDTASGMTLLMVIGVVTVSGALVSKSTGLAAWLSVAAGLGVLWQASALTLRAPLAVGAGVAIGGFIVFLTRHRRMAVS